MQKHPKLLIILGIFSFILIFGLIWSGVKSPQAQNHQAESSSINDKASGDNENEVLRTVLANQEELRTENKALQEKNNELQQRGFQSAQQMIQSAKQSMQSEMEKLKTAFQGQVDNQKKDISTITQEMKHQENGGYTIDGSNAWTDAGNAKPQVITTVTDLSSSYQKPSKNNQNNQENNTTDDSAPSLPSDLEKPSKAISSKDTSSSDSEGNSITPYYTIPSNSTLNHVKLMTSIIGEVPVSGKLVAPAFPFKAIIGKKELYAANGASIPDDLAGTVIQGYSVGNMTLSCARLYVTRLLFVFNDGHFVVYPTKNDEDSATDLYPKDALGYLSDAYGNTCLPGKYITDAPKVLTNLALLGGLNTGANAAASSQFTTLNSGTNLATGFTGNMSKLVGASFLSGGSQEVLNWYKARVDDVFDAVFIPASFHHRPTNLVLNVTQTIPIDLNQKGRTLRYENKQAYTDHFKALD